MSILTSSERSLQRSLVHRLLRNVAGVKESWRISREFATLETFNDRQLWDLGLWREPIGSHRRHLLRF